MTTLRDEARRLAEEVTDHWDHTLASRTESALLAFAKLVLEREPSSNLIQAAEDRMIEGAGYIAENSVQYALWKEVYRAMTAELLRELEEK